MSAARPMNPQSILFPEVDDATIAAADARCNEEPTMPALAWLFAHDEALDFLNAHGFKLTKFWTWLEPAGREATADEWNAINYLFQEWDFGGLDRLDFPNGH